MKRREFIKQTAISVLAAGAASQPPQPKGFAMKKLPNSSAQLSSKSPFWPDGARMVISMSMQMEGGAQPASGAESPMPKIDPQYPDLPAGKWYDYGYKEGLPRLLEMFERRKVKVTSHMVGAAVDLHPALAKEIVERGHEASGHGQTWSAQYSMTPDEERASYQHDRKVPARKGCRGLRAHDERKSRIARLLRKGKQTTMYAYADRDLIGQTCGMLLKCVS
jgi:peptidoglycan/xylan/chitin deacetylase (PgdA/CDA1 family)